jgi:3-deoxy-D-arabino-heptulosonate 7-phosphate (DAHP) synthase class II
MATSSQSGRCVRQRQEEENDDKRRRVMMMMMIIIKNVKDGDIVRVGQVSGQPAPRADGKREEEEDDDAYQRVLIPCVLGGVVAVPAAIQDGAVQRAGPRARHQPGAGGKG